MKELEDYSGEFRPDLRMEDFSKKALQRLWTTGAKMFVGIDGIWLTVLREKLGDKKAYEMATEMWKRGVKMEVRFSREAMNIRGDDVASLLKNCQIDPGVAGIMEVECELKDKNVGILTVKSCRALDYFERHAHEELLKHGCGLDVWAYEMYAKEFNPKIKTTCLKLPPRKNREEIACQWEFRMTA